MNILFNKFAVDTQFDTTKLVITFSIFHLIKSYRSAYSKGLDCRLYNNQETYTNLCQVIFAASDVIGRAGQHPDLNGSKQFQNRLIRTSPVTAVMKQ